MTRETLTQSVVLTPRELSERWKLSVDRVLALVRSGALRGAFNIAPGGRGRRWRIPLRSVEEFEATRAACPTSMPD